MERRLQTEKNIVPIYLSLWQIYSFTLKMFLEKLIIAILEGYHKKLSLKHSISDLMKTPVAMLRKILESSIIGATLRDELEFTLSFEFQSETDYSKLFEKAFTLPEIITKDTNTKCVLILDEFPSLLELKEGISLVRAMRSIHEPQQRTVFCIASSVRKYMDAVAMSETSPFYKKLVLKGIKPLTEAEVGLLLEINAREYGIKIIEEGVQEMFHYTKGIPFYDQFLGKVAAGKQSQLIDKGVIERVERGKYCLLNPLFKEWLRNR